MKNKKSERNSKKIKHPEVEFQGLNCDIQLWANFNKELRLREIMDEERAILNHMVMLLGKPESCNFKETYGEAERLYAVSKLSLLVQLGKVDRFTYEVKDESYSVHINSDSI